MKNINGMVYNPLNYIISSTHKRNNLVKAPLSL